MQQFTCSTPYDLSTATVLDNSNFYNRTMSYDTRNQKRFRWTYFDSTFGGSVSVISSTFDNTGTALYITTSSGSLDSRHSVFKLEFRERLGYNIC